MNWEIYSDKYQKHLLSYSETYGSTWYDMWKSKEKEYTLGDAIKETTRLLDIVQACEDRAVKDAGMGIMRIMFEIVRIESERIKYEHKKKT